MNELDHLKEGDFFFAEIIGIGEISVFIKEDGEYFIAGNWEGDYKPSELKFIEKIQKPTK